MSLFFLAAHAHKHTRVIKIRRLAGFENELRRRCAAILIIASSFFFRGAYVNIIKRAARCYFYKQSPLMKMCCLFCFLFASSCFCFLTRSLLPFILFFFFRLFVFVFWWCHHSFLSTSNSDDNVQTNFMSSKNIFLFLH